MSILIKGMEMPKTGEYRCVIRKWGEEITIDLYGNEELCGTLIPVPAHGRLIDGDHLKHTHCAECTLYPDKCLEKTVDGCDWGSIIHLRMCPTIIPSDKEDV